MGLPCSDARPGTLLVLSLTLLSTLFGLIAPFLNWREYNLLSQRRTIDGTFPTFAPDVPYPEFANEFDCTIGASIFTYNSITGTCGSYDEIPAEFKSTAPPTLSPEELQRQEANYASYWDSFSMRSLMCGLADPEYDENTDFIESVGSVSPPTPDPNPIPTTEPAPVVGVSASSEDSYDALCGQLEGFQAVSLLGPIMGAAASVLLVLFFVKGKDVLAVPALFSLAASVAFGLATSELSSRRSYLLIFPLQNALSGFTNLLGNTLQVTQVGNTGLQNGPGYYLSLTSTMLGFLALFFSLPYVYRASSPKAASGDTSVQMSGSQV